MPRSSSCCEAGAVILGKTNLTEFSNVLAIEGLSRRVNATKPDVDRGEIGRFPLHG